MEEHDGVSAGISAGFSVVVSRVSDGTNTQRINFVYLCFMQVTVTPGVFSGQDTEAENQTHVYPSD